MFLADNETKVDLLNNEAIATTIVELLRSRPDQPITVGVHGDWGAGKSSVLEMIEDQLNTDDKILCLKFNGWRFQGFEDAKIALIEGIVTGLVENRPALRKAGDAVKATFRRIDWLKVAKKAGGLAFTAFTGVPTLDQIETLVSGVEGLLADPGKIATVENAKAALATVTDVLKSDDNQTKNVPEEIEAFRKEFKALLKAAGVDQLVVLIDDLDRCLPDTAIETLEAVRLFVFTAHTAFVVAADEAMIEYSVRKHFPDLPDTTGPQTYARNYLEKLIQVPFRIPALGDTETRIYVTLLLIGADIGEDHAAFGDLLTAARGLLKRPWKGETLDAETVRVALGDAAPRAGNALALSDQIGPILASGTHGNPRQIKRFLNSLILRQRTAAARGFGEDVKLPVLAKLMLAERFLPRLFDQIAESAAASADGKCVGLSDLEAAANSAVNSEIVSSVTEESQPTAKTKRPSEVESATSEHAPKSATVSEWISAPPIRTWATVKPLIAEEDLRPYLFVAKDRKDYFGAASVLGHLATVVEQLFGDKFSVLALEEDLRRLVPLEAARVFEAVRGRVMGGDSFAVEPAGVVGMSVLVKAQPTLQDSLMSFLEALPPSRLGPWACSGWESALKDPESNQRFDSLLEVWAKDGGGMLKAAAGAVVRTRRGRP